MGAIYGVGDAGGNNDALHMTLNLIITGSIIPDASAFVALSA